MNVGIFYKKIYVRSLVKFPNIDFEIKLVFKRVFQNIFVSFIYALYMPGLFDL